MKKECNHKYHVGWPGEAFQWCKGCGAIRLWKVDTKTHGKRNKVYITMKTSVDENDGWCPPNKSWIAPLKLGRKK